MEITNQKQNEFVQRLLSARIRLLCNHGFFGLLLVNLKFALDDSVVTAATDAESIIFAPSFLDKLSNDELDFVLMHEVLHVALKHCFRGVELDNELYNIACDTVINSMILESYNDDKSFITVSGLGEVMHLAPDGVEGRNYTAEEVYYMLLSGGMNSGGKSKNSNNKRSSVGSNQDGDSESDSNGQNSTTNNLSQNNRGGNGQFKPSASNFDCHDTWKDSLKDEFLQDKWTSRVSNAVEAVEKREQIKRCGSDSILAKRIFDKFVKPVLDWRTILQNFIQIEVVDFSFNPPDKRYDEFFLPDFNETDEKVEKLLFMIDTSGSMSDKEITACFSEIKGAIEQFDGKIEGWLGFFDAIVVPPKPFNDFETFKRINALGGGGTNFHTIFSYVKDKMIDDLPYAIIILTDGYAKFPKEEMAMDIPVLWIINNNDVTPPWGVIARLVS